MPVLGSVSQGSHTPSGHVGGMARGSHTSSSSVQAKQKEPARAVFLILPCVAGAGVELRPPSG